MAGVGKFAALYGIIPRRDAEFSPKKARLFFLLRKTHFREVVYAETTVASSAYMWALHACKTRGSPDLHTKDPAPNERGLDMSERWM